MRTELPHFLINPSIARSNIAHMAQKARQSGVRFRPHFKTHQSRLMGSWFREAGVDQITVSSLSMARYFADDGWDDILIALPVVHQEVSAINELAGLIKLGVLVEQAASVIHLSKHLTNTVDVWIKADTGYHRTGIDYTERALILALAEQIIDTRWMRFRGILSHFGHTYHAGSTSEIKSIYQEDSAKLMRLKKWLDAEGIAAEVSVGDTPSCSLVEDFGGVDEIRPGNFVFYDAMQKNLGSCSHAQIAGIMVCSVIACHPARLEVVIHGGAVHFSKDYLLREGQMVFGEMVPLSEQGWGEPLEGCFIERLSQEHGIVRVTEDVMKQIQVGDLLGFFPVHSCLTADAMGLYKLTTGEWADHFDKYDNNPLVNS